MLFYWDVFTRVCILISVPRQLGVLKLPSKHGFLFGHKDSNEDMPKWSNFKLARRCPMCLGEEKLAGHLFCPLSVGLHIVAFVISLMGVSWVRPQTIRDVLVAWRRRLRESWILGVWKLIPLAIWWSTWMGKNCLIFEGKARTQFKISNFIS